MPKTAVIVLNYNGQKYLTELFDSLNKTVYPQADWQIFFVDNASIDESLAWAQKHYPKCRFIKNEKNFGFAGGNNVGLQAALKENFDYVVLLNQDTTVEPDWLARLVEKAESDKTIGAAQSLLLLYDQPDLINTAGNHLHYLGFGWAGQYKTKACSILSTPLSAESAGRTEQIDYASGAAVLYRSSVLKTAGLLDDKFFLYHEDLDLSWRLRLAGCLIVLAPQSRVYHKYEFSRNRTKFYFTERNRLICFLANYSLKTIILFLPALVFIESAVLLYAALGYFLSRSCKKNKISNTHPEDNLLNDKIKGYGWIFKNFSYIIKKRRYVQSRRTVSDSEIIKYMKGDLEFAGIQNPLARLAGVALKLYFKIIKQLV